MRVFKGQGMENRYTFLQSYAPSSESNEVRELDVYFRGLNVYGADGYLSDGINFEITPDGTVRTASLPTLWQTLSGTVLTFFASGRYLFAVTKNESTGKCTLTRFDTESKTASKATADLGSDEWDGASRSLASYSKWTGGSDIVSGKYEDVLLIFPDKKSISLSGDWSEKAPEALARYDITRTVKTETVTTERTYNNGWTQNADGTYTLPAQADGENKSVDVQTESTFYDARSVDEPPEDILHPTRFSTSYATEDVHGSDGTISGKVLYVKETAVTVTETFESKAKTGAIPNAERITIHNTRLFGADKGKIFASGAGSYADYELDTATDFDENNAWYSATSGEAFTALTEYDGRVTAFKPQGLYQVYGSKNPFRVKEISKVGTSFGNTVCETESILYYAGETGLYGFGGSYPRNLSLDRLDMGIFSGGAACGGAYAGRYYFSRGTSYASGFTSKSGRGKHPIFVYDAHTGVWSVICFSGKAPAFFAATDKGLFVIASDGGIWKFSKDSRSGTEFYYTLPTKANLPSSRSNGAITANVKHLSHLQAVFRFRSVGKVSISILFDNGEERLCGGMERGIGTHPLYISVLPGDHIARQIKIEGQGDIELLSLEQIFKAGGVRYGQGS